MNLVDKALEKFKSASELTPVQNKRLACMHVRSSYRPRCASALTTAHQDLATLHKVITDVFTNGIVGGYTKEFLGSFTSQTCKLKLDSAQA